MGLKYSFSLIKNHCGEANHNLGLVYFDNDAVINYELKGIIIFIVILLKDFNL